MAKQTWNNPIDKTVDWGGDATTDNLPVSGEMVQRFIKESLDGKAGLFHYDATNNRYLVFADADARDEYLLDPTQTDLILGTFDAPFNYSAEINLSTPAYNAVALGSTGNYIEFTFDIKNKQGASTGENVIITYTFLRNAIKHTVTETRKFGDAVRFNIDKYLGEGTNSIIVGITGQTSLAATTVAITYQVVNLTLEDDMDISKSYNLSNGSQQMGLYFTVSGYGTKIVEWYIDGVLQPFVKSDDEVVDVTATRAKYFTLSNLQQGAHSLQFRAYTLVNGEKFYTDTLYRDFMVYTGADSEVIIGVAVTIPKEYGVLGANDRVAIYDMVQYVPYALRFATYSPSNAASTEVTISVDGKEIGKVGSANNIENSFVFTSTTSGNKTLKLATSNVSREMPIVVKETDMDIQEIDNGLVLDFTASGKSNNSPDKDTWTDGVHSATLEGFNWNTSSGWVDGRLEMSAGSSITFDYAPLDGNTTNTGKTIEVEWSTKNVTNDDAIICDLRGENGVGILISATKVSMTSADGVVVETEYKSDENVRIGFVINQAQGTTNRRLSFIYANGIISRAEKWAVTDNYISDAPLKFMATAEAQISLKSIRIYDAALSSDNMLNNYTLYRDTIEEMLEVYDRNDVYEEGTVSFSYEKMMGRLPVMIVTGDIPTLENTSDKDTQIVVDIEYHNLQDPDKSFTMKNAAMRPQGTSSMGYPKKNFRIYTEKVENTEVYDANGNPIANKLYSFKDGAQPVNCWCLKADYAESSGTHNTGIARLWNEALFNAQVDGEYKLRTGAQKAAIAAGYPYDVRTTIDGFPILLFYRPSANDSLIFIGKYNFNNDKSTESVFGFEGIPNFNNEKMQCWEVLNNGNALSLFTTADGFDEGWSEAFESRYPDTKTPYTGDLKAFCEWMTSVSQSDFATQKWEHLNVYMMAAYWCYLMRHAAADQFVKNAMFTSEDGQHFYYILYDNDTINGLINTGRLRIKPTDNRQTVDETGSYVFAGHDSRLWNMLEADEEFMSIVSAVDNALYSAGISYANTIRIFDEEQADKWVEKVYNQDAQYKYVGPYVEKGIDNLFMLQGKRDLHRRWWLAKRFSIYDAKYVSGTYKSQAIEIKCLNGTSAGQQFSIVAGYPLDYGYGINDVPRSFGISLDAGDSHVFETKEVVNLGDPIRIYGAPHLSEVDFSKMADRLAVVTIANVYEESLGTKLTRLVLGNASKINAEVTEISGLKQAMALEYLDVQGMTKINSLDLSNHQYFKTLKAMGSGVSSVSFAKGAPVERLELPATMRVLSLTQLPYLTAENVVLENVANLQNINISACPNLSNDFDFIYDWYTKKTSSDTTCSLIMDAVDWQNVDVEKFIELANITNLSLKGKVYLNSISLEQMYVLMDKFGESAFNEDAEFFIDGPANAFVLGNTEVLEGTSETYKVVAFGGKAKSIQFSLYNGSNSYTSVTQNGVLTVKEGFGQGTFTMRVIVTTEDETFYTDVVISVAKRIYPTASNLTIEGSASIESDYHSYSLSYPDNVNGEFDTAWTLTANEEGYVGIDSFDDFGCTLKRLQDTYLPIYLTLTATLTKKVNGAAVATVSKDIVYINEDVAETDPGIIAALYGAGLCSSDKFITKEEAARVTASDLQPSKYMDTSIFYSHRNNIKSFNGFQYFTGITEVPVYCLYDTAVESVILHNGITSIGASAFKSCDNLKSINMPRSLISIGDEGFRKTLLESVDLPEGFMSLGNNVFTECYQLKSFKIPSTLTSITEIFSGCESLQFYVSENNPSLKAIDGVLFNKDVTSLLLFRDGARTKEYTIPSSVTRIGDYGFYRTSIEIVNHSSGLHLGVSALTECPALRRLNAKVLSFAASPALNYCPLLESIVLAESVDRLPQYCFMQCLSLKTIYSESETAPTLNPYVFGTHVGTYVGRNTYNTGENFLYVPLNAKGYNESDWANTLLNANACGFSIYGQLTISSNRTFAQFSVTYTTTSGAMKGITVGVGTFYLSDVQYGTSMTIVPITTGVGEWDWTTKTIIYGRDNNSVENNAYVFPQDATIVGESNPVENGTYTWSTTTANIDDAYIAEWSLTGEITSYINIESQNNTECVLSIREVPADFVYGTLSLTIKKLNGSVIVTVSKELGAVLEGVLLTTRSNGPVQKVLYNAGLVANENYTLIAEAREILWSDINSSSSYTGSIFYNKTDITKFDEFEYFTGLSKIPYGCFYGCENLESIKLPPNIKEIEGDAFSTMQAGGGAKITNLVIPEGVEKINYYAFLGCTHLEHISLPSTLKEIGSFRYAKNLKSINIPKGLVLKEVGGTTKLPEQGTEVSIVVDADHPTLCSVNNVVYTKDMKQIIACRYSTKGQRFEVPEGVTTLYNGAFYGQLFSEIILPSSLVEIQGSALAFNALQTLVSFAPYIPTVDSYAFGGVEFNLAGRDNYNKGTNKLHIPLNATGYNTGAWLDPLQNPQRCGFTIYGPLTITSNKSDAQFNLSYTTVDGTINQVTVGVGKCYLSDIKYDTQMTITPVAISGYTWSEASKTFVYNDSAQRHEFNACIYPTAIKIEGTGSLVGGKSATYSAALAPGNFDVPVTYTWSVSGSSNVSITPDGSTCVVNTNSVEAEENFTLTCVAKSYDNKVTLEASRLINLTTRPNFIIVTYDIPESATIQLIANTGGANLSQIKYMEIDGEQVTPTLSYYFTAGIHTMKIINEQYMGYRFYGCSYISSIDFSNCDGALVTNIEYAFNRCTSLKTIYWGECKFNNITSLRGTFGDCKNLQSLDLSAFNNAPINNMNRMCMSCSALSSIVLPTLTVSTVDCGHFLYGSSLAEVDLSPLAGVKGNILFDFSFRLCSKLESLDFTPLAYTPMFYSNTFSGCTKLSTIILPFMTAPATDSYTFGTSTSSGLSQYTGYSTRGRNVLYVPNGATGYDTDVWLDPLQDSNKCGFTISYTL